MNVYSYVHNNPINSIDPLGLETWAQRLSQAIDAGLDVIKDIPVIGAIANRSGATAGAQLVSGILNAGTATGQQLGGDHSGEDGVDRFLNVSTAISNDVAAVLSPASLGLGGGTRAVAQEAKALTTELKATAQAENAVTASRTTALGEQAVAPVVAPETLVQAGARGRASETRVLDDLGLKKNTQKVTSAEGVSIPDALTDALSLEIKDTKSVALTAQLRIQTDCARAGGRQSVLVTGTHTQVSGPAKRAFDQIIRRDDLGPKK
jgi:hypothetical protein